MSPSVDPYDWAAVYPPGVRRRLDVPDVTLGDALRSSAARDPAATALSAPGGDVTYADLLARSLLHAGRTRAGERVLIRESTGVRFAEIAFGTYLAGGVLVPVAPDAPDAVVAEIRDDVTADGPLPTGAPGPTDTAVLQFTSGTTGGRKAAMMSHRNLVANALQNNTWFGWSAADVILGALPLHHTWGLSCVLHATVLAGARAVLIPRFDAADVLAAIERERVTIAYGSATMFHRLLDAAGADASRIFASLRYVKAGAMLVGGDLLERWTAAVPDVPMILGYGLTEASPEVCNNPLLASREGTVGVPLPGTELRLRDPFDPERAATGDGELHVRGPQVTTGYWNRPDATREAIVADGWLRTGDLAAFDECGYVRIVDRLKDLIKFRGYSIVAAVVESALRRCPGVADAVVVGVAHAVDGEVPVAFIVPSRTAAPDVATIRERLGEHLLHHEIPRRFEVIVEIPRNAVGKPLRRVLRDRAQPQRQAVQE